MIFNFYFGYLTFPGHGHGNDDHYEGDGSKSAKSSKSSKSSGGHEVWSGGYDDSYGDDYLQIFPTIRI